MHCSCSTLCMVVILSGCSTKRDWGIRWRFFRRIPSHLAASPSLRKIVPSGTATCDVGPHRMRPDTRFSAMRKNRTQFDFSACNFRRMRTFHTAFVVFLFDGRRQVNSVSSSFTRRTPTPSSSHMTLGRPYYLWRHKVKCRDEEVVWKR